MKQIRNDDQKSVKSNKGSISNGALLRMFQSDYFDVFLHMYYLLNRTEEGIQDYLVNLLYQRDFNEINYFLPQICQIALENDHVILRKFLTDIAAVDINIALREIWNFQSATNDSNLKLNEIAHILKENVEMAVVNKKPILELSKFMTSDQTNMNNIFVKNQLLRYLESSKTNVDGEKLEICLRLQTELLDEISFNTICRSVPDSQKSKSITLSNDQSDSFEKNNKLVDSVDTVSSNELKFSKNKNSINQNYSPPKFTVKKKNLIVSPELEQKKQVNDPSIVISNTDKIIINDSTIKKNKRFILKDSFITIMNCKITLLNPFVVLGSPYIHPVINLRNHNTKLFDSDYNSSLLKQKRCNYFNIVDKFISLMIDVSNRLIVSSDKSLRKKILQKFLYISNRWIQLKFIHTAAQDDVFYMSGVTFPLRKFINTSNKDLNFLLSSGILRNNNTNHIFNSLQIVSILPEETKIFFSRTRSPFLLVFELADLDEDINNFINNNSILKDKPKLENYESTFKSLFEGKNLDVKVYQCLKRILIYNSLYIPPFSENQLPYKDYMYISEGDYSTVDCEVCTGETDNINNIEINLSPNNLYFMFSCPYCNGTKLFNNLIKNDSPYLALKRSSKKFNSIKYIDFNIENDHHFFVNHSNHSQNDNSDELGKNLLNKEEKRKIYRLHITGEPVVDQSERLRKLIWSEKWEETEERIRKNSPFGELKTWKLGAVIVKGGDDLRQEVLTNQIINLCQIIFKKAGLPLWFHSYEILVTGSNNGLIEYIPNTQSLDNIKQLFNVESASHVFEAAFADILSFARKNFIESHAAYSLVSYLLQVKDRHNGNLLLSNKGRIIHIDFGFMLASSPGNVNFENSPFKLSSEILDIIGGVDTDNFEYFKELLIKGFFELKKNADKIVLLVEMMSNAPKMACFGTSPGLVIQGLKERLMVNLNQAQCINRVLNLVELSINNWRTNQYDNFQRYTNGIL